ncbi:MAG: adenosylmethionine-8-amino-7-oxononanoate aminotransferase [Chitinophagaceae bacterium]|nr:adenosylmethionine-8-amino-7-oxononanoate aminotransferase [Chitinophagaceae bacterium]
MHNYIKPLHLELKKLEIPQTILLCRMNLAEKDKKFVWHPFTHQKSMADPIAIVKGKGSLLFDEKGNSYIDAISSWWVNIHGHAHPYIAEKIYQQALTLEQVIFAGFTHEPAVTLAEKLIEHLGSSFHKIFYSDNGSTSTEVAIKMALQYWWNQGFAKKKRIIAFKNSYHGDTFGAMSVSDRSVFTMAFHELLVEVIFIDAPTSANISTISQIIAEHAGETAAIIFEPLVQGAGGMLMHDAEALSELILVCKKNSVICIADEVMTGFGRTGTFFAFQQLTEQPDIICLSKGLTGGTMALGVTACNENIYEAFVSDDKLKTFFHGHSFTANPLACTAAIASMEIFENENVIDKIKQIENWNNQVIEEIQKHRLVKNPRICGTILAFEIDKGKNEYLNDISTVFTTMALERGVYLRPLGNTFYWMPPYCISEEELDRIKNVTIEILNKIATV